MAKIISLCQKFKRYLPVALIFLVAGFALADCYFNFQVKPKLAQAIANNVVVRKINITNNPYPDINPLIGFDIGERQPSAQYQGLQNNLNQTITAAEASGQITDVGVYFRDLQSGRWTGVNENDKFAPASVIKVALMIAYYKISEDDPSALTKQLAWDGQTDANQNENIQPEQSIKPKVAYSVNDLINFMIKDSDNNAMLLLLNNFDPNTLNGIFSDLMIDASIQNGTGDVISPKQISLMFRLLYNATYLNERLSEQALELLATSEYKNDLAAGVPPNVKVAAKFGERTVAYQLTNNDVVEFHDCGIIYFPSHPYFLCIMTKGGPGSLDQLQQTVAQISTMVYGQVKNDNPQ